MIFISVFVKVGTASSVSYQDTPLEVSSQLESSFKLKNKKTMEKQTAEVL